MMLYYLDAHIHQQMMPGCLFPVVNTESVPHYAFLLSYCQQHAMIRKNSSEQGMPKNHALVKKPFKDLTVSVTCATKDVS